MPNQGGRYEIRDGKRVLVERTKSSPDPDFRPKANPKPAANPAPKKSSTDVKEKNDG